MKYPSLFLLSVMLCNCSGNNESTLKTIDILTPSGPELKSVSEIATDVQYIPLQTAPDAIFKFVIDLKKTNDKF
jgi:hypothetical protein